MIDTHSVMTPAEVRAMGHEVPARLAPGERGEPPMRVRLTFTATRAVVDGACAWLARHGVTDGTKRFLSADGGES